MHAAQEPGIGALYLYRPRTPWCWAAPQSHEHAIRTFMDWNIDVNQAMFLSGLAKGEFLHEFELDFFLDDQIAH